MIQAAEAAPLPQIEADQAVTVITGFIRGQMAQTGFEHLVVGLSGGVDSATVAFIAARAIGPDRLVAVRMPYRTSSAESDSDALRVVEVLGCRTERVDISPMVDPLIEQIGPDDDPGQRLRRGNVMARQRMIVLYDRSVAYDALVVGTSNKTEMLLGYTTLFGDMACAFAPIGDLYKSQLRAVATCVGVPEEIVSKAPSADLWPGQTDEDELGATYDALDRILFALVDRRWTEERCVAAGLDRDLVRWVAHRVAQNEYKRQFPPVAKVSLRTPGIDHLYPRRRPGSRRGG